MRIGLLTAITFVMFSAIACKHVNQDPSRSKIIFGETDFVKVDSMGSSIPANYRNLIHAIGYLDSGCTVSHIGNGLVLTAAHCLSNDELFPDNPEQCLRGRSIQFGIFKDGVKGPKATCIKFLYGERNINRDVALLYVENWPNDKIDVELENKPAPDTTITLFSHPDGRPLEWSKDCSLIPVKYCSFKDAFAFMCDSEPGSSGSLLLSANTATPKALGVLRGPSDEGDKNCASRITANEASAKIKFYLEKYGVL